MERLSNNQCTYVNKCTCGFCMTCREENEKGETPGDEEGLSAGEGHSYPREVRANCSSRFKSVRNFLVLVVGKCIVKV